MGGDGGGIIFAGQIPAAPGIDWPIGVVSALVKTMESILHVLYVEHDVKPQRPSACWHPGDADSADADKHHIYFPEPTNTDYSVHNVHQLNSDAQTGVHGLCRRRVAVL